MDGRSRLSIGASSAPPLELSGQNMEEPSGVRARSPAEELLSTQVITSDHLRSAIQFDGPDKPLPFHLVQQVLSNLQQAQVQDFLEAVKNLAIWRPHELAWLLFQQMRLRRGAEWQMDAIPHVYHLRAVSKPGSALHAWTAWWLAENAPEDPSAILDALLDSPSDAASPGQYIRYLQLWLCNRSSVDSVLPRAISHLADAWSTFGDDRLTDRLAVAALLARALQLRSVACVGPLCDEARVLSHVVPDPVHREALAAAADVVGRGAQQEPPKAPLEPNEEALRGLLRDCSAEALRFARAHHPPRDPDGQVRWAVLTALATQRVRTTGSALALLNTVPQLLAQTRADTAWLFHMVRSGICSLRTEYHSAFLEIEAARRFAARAANHQLLFHSIVARQRLAKETRLSAIREECQRVLAALDLFQESSGRERYESRAFSIAKALEIEGRTYSKTVPRLRELQDLWTVFLRSRDHFSGPERAQRKKFLEEQIQEAAQHIPPEADEPTLVAMFRSQQMALTLNIHYDQGHNEQLYENVLKPGLDQAINLGVKLKNYRLLDDLKAKIQPHRAGLLKNYRLPVAFHRPRLEVRELLAMREHLRAAGTLRKRQEILRVARRRYAHHLRTLGERRPDQEEFFDLLNILQDLKQPVLEGDVSPPQQTWPDVESVLDDDVADADVIPLYEAKWANAAGERLTREAAVCLELFTGGEDAFCFVLRGEQGRLVGNVVPLCIKQERMMNALSEWRQQLRTSAMELESHSDPLYMKTLAAQIQQDLNLHGDLFPTPLERTLLKRPPRVVYVAPTVPLYDLPLHALRGLDGFSLSSIGPVLQIAKTQQLAAHHPPPSVAGVCVVAGPEEVFQRSGQQLARRVGATFADPKTRGDLVRTLRDSEIVAILGHGWLDEERPPRSRVALQHGLRLTLRDFEDLEMRGTEIVLLSCWTGSGLRGDLPGAVLAPLWPIPIEAGGRFIGDYIDERRRGLTRAGAIQRARTLSEHYEYGPLCSAAYVLWGVESSARV